MRTLWLALLLVAGGCIDTSVPDLSLEMGNGPTDGPLCTAEDMEGFPPQTLKIHVIDVGQGDAIWVQTPWYSDPESESLDVLIDTGPSGQLPDESPGGAVVVDYLLRHGMLLDDPLDAVVVTHAHADHYGGLPEVVAAFHVARYVDPGDVIGKDGFFAARSTAIAEVTALGGSVASPAMPGLAANPFDEVDLFGSLMEARILWGQSTPPGGETSADNGTSVNNTSVVFALTWAKRQVLLMADVEQELEAALLFEAAQSGKSLASHVLKVGHHGSGNSTSEAFLAAVFPVTDDNSWAVISSGRKSFGGGQLPAQATVDRLDEKLPDFHLLSTERRDEEKAAGTEHDDDHVIILIGPDGHTRACYAN